MVVPRAAVGCYTHEIKYLESCFYLLKQNAGDKLVETVEIKRK